MGYITKFDGNTDKTISLGVNGGPSVIEGYFLGSKTTPDTGFGPGKLHIFQTADGSIGVWGKTRLNNLLTDDLRGQMVKATFTGMIQPNKKGRRPSYGFQVQHDPGNTVPVAGINLNAAPVVDAEDEDNDSIAASSYDSSEDDVSDEIVPPQPVAPKVVATAADADRKARMQALLNKSKK